MKAVIKKELRQFFYSPVAYVLAGMFIFVTATVFSSSFTTLTVNFKSMFTSMSLMLMFVIPLLTMRIIAEENKNGTTRLLLSLPNSMYSIVLGKFIAAWIVFMLITVLSLVFPIMVSIFGGWIPKSMWCGYIGFVLMGTAFISIGLFFSAITENQVQAAIISIVVFIATWIADTLAYIIGGATGKILTYFSFYSRFDEYMRGILSLENSLYFISITIAMFGLTTLFMIRKRWSK